MGLPMELLAEEAAVLASRGVARVVDDAALHRARLASLTTAAAARSRSRRRRGRGGAGGSDDGDGGASDGSGDDDDDDGGGGVDRDTWAAGRAYLDDIRSERKKIEEEAVEQSRQMRLRQAQHTKKAKAGKKPRQQQQQQQQQPLSPTLSSPRQGLVGTTNTAEGEEAGLDGSAGDTIFDDDALSSRTAAADTPTTNKPRPTFGVTPTTSGALLFDDAPSPSPPPSPSPAPTPTPATSRLTSSVAVAVAVADVPAPYPLYAHLHGRGYYLMPGLRFGCDYNVYPGDPLRFHSHFQASCLGWDQEVAVLDLVAGGRLGTGVKKGFLVGGAVVRPPGEEEEYDDDDDDDDGNGVDGGGPGRRRRQERQHVRAFCIEWAGM